MNGAHLHLLLNHLPVLGTIFALLLLAFGVLRGNVTLTRTALWTFVLAAVAGVVVYLTGEPAEEIVEGLPGVTEAIVEAHEEAALLATALLGGFGLLSLGGLMAFRRRGVLSRGFSLLLLGLSLVPAAAMGYAGNLGGQIRHTEIRADAVAAAGGEQGGGGEVGEAEHD